MGTMSQAFGRIVSSSNSGCVLLYPRPAAQCFFLSFLFLLPPGLPASSKKTLSPPPVCHDVTSSNIFFFSRGG